MALTNQPYIPLYVKDVQTDQDLRDCSAEAYGVLLLLLCALHQQKTYGLLCLKQKHKQSESKYENFARQLAVQMPFEQTLIAKCLMELEGEDRIQITDTELGQRRMVRDGAKSLRKANSGKAGGETTRKLYGKPGILYLMSDRENIHKIGVSINPQNRLYRYRSDLKLDTLQLIKSIKVDDMGIADDAAEEIFSGLVEDGFIKMDFDSLLDKFALLEAKPEANVEANVEATVVAFVAANTENATAIENANKTKEKRGAGEKNQKQQSKPDEAKPPEKTRYWFLRYYHAGYDDYKSVFNGQSASREVFQEWADFISLIYDKNYEQILETKFINPKQFGEITAQGFGRENWEPVLKKILATGVKPEHDLFFRIPEFLNYIKNGKRIKNTGGSIVFDEK